MDPMMMAAKNGHVDIVRMLLDHGMDPLLEICQHLFICCGDLDRFISLGKSLSVSVLEGHTSVVGLLIERGCTKITKRDMDKKSQVCDLLLCLAVMKRHIPIIKLLLAEGCNPNMGHKAPLHYVAAAPATNTTMEIVRLLVDAGADIMSELSDQSPFSLALETGNEAFINYAFEQGITLDIEVILDMVVRIAEHQKRMAAFLLDKIDLDSTINFSESARYKLLCAAATGGFEELMKRLLVTAPALGRRAFEHNHDYIMGLAVASGNIGMIELLLEQDTSLDCAVSYPSVLERGMDGEMDGEWDPDSSLPPMVLALDRSHDDVVKYLINKDFDVKLASEYRNHFLFNRALYLGKVEILQMLFETSSPPIEDIALSNDGLAILLAVLGGEAVFKLLLDHGVQLRPDCVGHCRALACAAMLADVPILRIFLDEGFSLDVQSSDHGTLRLSLKHDKNRGSTLLALAAQAKDRNAAETAVDLLLERGAQLNQPMGSYNHTPLLCTVSGEASQNVSDIEYFVDTIKRTEEDIRGCPFRYHLEHNCEVPATKLLLDKGADPLFRTRSGISALNLAAKRNDIKLVKMMLEYVGQTVPISTIKSHILLAATATSKSMDNSCCLTCSNWDKKQPSLTIQRILWDYYWRNQPRNPKSSTQGYPTSYRRVRLRVRAHEEHKQPPETKETRI
jgi:ankyrin repeat protein